MPVRSRFALLAACFLWAVSFIATKIALESTPPLTVVTLRLVVSALCFLIWAVPAGRVTLNRRWLPRLALLSLFGASLHYGTQTLGLQFTTASNASLYAITAPITIAILGALVLGEHISGRKAAGIAIAIVGVLAVMGLETLLAVELGRRILGDLLVLASIVMWGLFTVLGKKATDELGALGVTATITILGAATMLPVGAIELNRLGFSPVSISLEAWMAIAFLGVGCSFLATLLYFVALARTETQKVGVFLYTIPPMTAALAALILGETLGAGFFIGSVLVFVGVWLTESG